MSTPKSSSVRDVALDAAVRQHFDARHAAGLSVPFEQISDRSRRIVRDQLAGTVDAVLEAVAPAYDREVLVTVLVYHQPTNTSGCHCGWGVLGASHAEHVADVYEESITARAAVSHGSGASS
jgi:predicted metalloprotease with PDZ domain